MKDESIVGNQGIPGRPFTEAESVAVVLPRVADALREQEGKAVAWLGAPVRFISDDAGEGQRIMIGPAICNTLTR